MQDRSQMKRMESIDIWERREDGTAVRYRCFRDLETERFCVQSADFYRSSMSSGDVLKLDKQFVELLVEDDPFSRSESYASIGQAIEAHCKEFE